MIIAKTISPCFLLTTLFSKDHRQEKERMNYDEVPGDNFPYVLMLHCE
ncbi:MAG: hypothetical protein HY209_01095 [Candidatus Omnitrophica bacterium]|nr:hypothetical protein [Candidatus Omnitrophota bacterium]